MTGAGRRVSGGGYAPPEKRSLTLRGHRTSVSLEPAFWQAFRDLAAARGLALNALAAEIDAARPPEVGLAGAIRQEVLAALTAARIDRAPDRNADRSADVTADRPPADQPMAARPGKVSSSQ